MNLWEFLMGRSPKSEETLPAPQKEEGPWDRDRREQREQREWEETSDDPIAKNHREWAAKTANEMLMAMAEREEREDRGWCSIAKSEIEHKNKLRSLGLVRNSDHQFCVTFLTNHGRRTAMNIRRLEKPEGWVHGSVCCTDCHHPMLEHNGRHPSLSEEKELLDAGEKPWDYHGHCRREGCDCVYCHLPIDGVPDGA